MAPDRALVDEAYAGDNIGLSYPGITSSGHPLRSCKKQAHLAGSPTPPPEHLARIEP